MNGNIRILILCVCVLCGLFDGSETSSFLKPKILKRKSEKPVKYFRDDLEDRKVDSTLYQTVNQYYCSLDSILEGSHLILFGTNGWTFPVQDVNLTLRYPPNVNEENKSFEYSIQDDLKLPSENEDYLVTGFKVILYIDGETSQGYIVEGGVLQESITLSFVSSQVTSLMYEFWLYGARKDTPGVAELNSHYRLCY